MQADLTCQQNVIFVSGDLNFKNVMSLHQKCIEQSQPLPELVFDFSRVTSSDSSGLALLVEWIKMAELAKKRVVIKGLSNGLVELAKVSGLDALINPLIS